MINLRHLKHLKRYIDKTEKSGNISRHLLKRKEIGEYKMLQELNASCNFWRII